jgi:hypothetical protein
VEVGNSPSGKCFLAPETGRRSGPQRPIEDRCRDSAATKSAPARAPSALNLENCGSRRLGGGPDRTRTCLQTIMSATSGNNDGNSGNCPSNAVHRRRSFSASAASRWSMNRLALRPSFLTTKRNALPVDGPRIFNAATLPHRRLAVRFDVERAVYATFQRIGQNEI